MPFPLPLNILTSTILPYAHIWFYGQIKTHKWKKTCFIFLFYLCPFPADDITLFFIIPKIHSIAYIEHTSSSTPLLMDTSTASENAKWSKMQKQRLMTHKYSDSWETFHNNAFSSAGWIDGSCLYPGPYAFQVFLHFVPVSSSFTGVRIPHWTPSNTSCSMGYWWTLVANTIKHCDMGW